MHTIQLVIFSLLSLLTLTLAHPTAHAAQVYGISLAERDTFVSCATACRTCRSCEDWENNADETGSCEHSCDTACMVDPFRYKADTACPTKTEELKARWNVVDRRGRRQTQMGNGI